MQNDQFDIEIKGDFINLRHGEGFEISPAKMNEFWTFLSEICDEHNCNKVLAEGPAPVRNMDTVAAFQSGVQPADVVQGFWLALCFDNYQPDEISELFVHAARNRGVHVKFFSDREKALRWLGVAGLEDDLSPSV